MCQGLQAGGSACRQRPRREFRLGNASSTLFVGMLEMPRWDATALCLRAAVGDAVMILFAYAAAAFGARDRAWMLRPSMPIDPVTGPVLTPILQWLILPLAILWAVRRGETLTTNKPVNGQQP